VAVTKRVCGTCRHFAPCVDLAHWEDDEPGSCEWLPPQGLPISWYMARSEVAGVGADTEATECPVWEERQ
jgi:hypothetical protein